MRTMNDAELRAAIDKQPAEKVTEEYIKSRMADVRYTYPTDTLTICIISLDNGFHVTGESACVNPENYNREIGDNLAYKHALSKLWPFFGFLLAERKFLASGTQVK